MDDAGIIKLTEAEIDALAAKYSEAVTSGNNSERKFYISELFRIVTGNSILNRKLKAQFSAFRVPASDKDMIISDYFCDNIKYYDVEKNNSFTAFMLCFFKQYIIKVNRKNRYTDSIEDLADEDDNTSAVIPDASDPHNAAELKLELCARIPSLILGFYQHISSKAATKARFFYFRIFNTEEIAKLIDIIGTSKYFNKNEAYESTDKEYIKFISYSDYTQLDDLLILRYKHIADVIEDYPDKQKLIEMPCGNKIIAEYLYASGNAINRPTDQNISAFRTKYDEYLKACFIDLKQ